MDPDQGFQRSYLFTIRLWTEPRGEGQVERRGQVQFVLGGERRSFRDWSTLMEYLEAKMQELDGAGKHPDENGEHMEPNLSVVFRDDQGMALHKPEVIWSILNNGPHLLDALSKREPAIRSICERLANRLPCQRVWGFGETDAYVRPDRHARAIYLRLSHIPGTHSSGGCIAIKGGEAVCENFELMIERLKNMWNILAVTFGDTARACFDEWGMISALDRFPLGEGKPPGVVSLHDVIEEAEFAFKVQKAHFEQYGELARLPLPLFAYAWPKAESERIWQQLKPHLSPAARPVVHAQLMAGLGTYVYYYPTLPLRVEHLQIDDVGGHTCYAERLVALSQIADPKEVTERWLALAARLLCLGYVPTRPTNVGRGYCVMAQNAVLDGGFVDLGGLQCVDDFQNEGDLAFAMSRTIQVLGHTIGRFLVGSSADTDVFTRRVPGAFALVWDGVRQYVEEEIALGTPVPVKVRQFMERTSPAADLLHLFSQLFMLDTYQSEDPEKTLVRLTP